MHEPNIVRGIMSVLNRVLNVLACSCLWRAYVLAFFECSRVFRFRVLTYSYNLRACLLAFALAYFACTCIYVT